MSSVETERIERTEDLPPMPRSVTVIMQALSDPDSDASQVELAIQYDSGLTASILRLANSVQFGFPGAIGSIRDAVVRLGRRRIMDLVVAASMSSRFQKEMTGYASPAGAFWEHSIATATAAELLEEVCRAGPVDGVFTCALLHDVGKLVMDEFVGECQSGIEASVAAGNTFDDAERLATGIDHAEVGARILSAWTLPAEIVLVARYHHRPADLIEPNTCVDLVHVADCLAMTIGHIGGMDGLSYKPSPEVLARLGISTRTLEQVAVRTLQRAEEITHSLGATVEASR